MATEGSYQVGGLRAHPLDVPKHQGADWQVLYVGEQTRVLSPDGAAGSEREIF